LSVKAFFQAGRASKETKARGKERNLPMREQGCFGTSFHTRNKVRENEFMLNERETKMLLPKVRRVAKVSPNKKQRGGKEGVQPDYRLLRLFLSLTARKGNRRPVLWEYVAED